MLTGVQATWGCLLPVLFVCWAQRVWLGRPIAPGGCPEEAHCGGLIGRGTHTHIWVGLM